jgi:membrane protein YdbS with pleckstrin-like domain
LLLGVAYLVLLGHIAFLFRAALLALILAALTIPALAALALVSAVCSLVVAHEAIRHREARVRLRHPDLAA